MSISRWFKKPSFAQGAPDEAKPQAAPAATSSPLTEPPSSFVFDQLSPSSEQDADAQLRAALLLSAQESAPKPAGSESFQTIISEGTSASQRVIKNGKETVISSDGEDTDSDDSLEDPSSLFARGLKGKIAKPPTQVKPVTSPKKWKYNLDALVHDAVDDNEVEANVHRYRSNMSQRPTGGSATLGNRLDENRLIEALGQKEDGPQPHRVLGAIRRTNALDYDRNWLFFDTTLKLPPAPEFPQHICPPGSQLEALKSTFFTTLECVVVLSCPETSSQ
ncbi:unnamed protein product [Penicillium bialowiezense]